MTLSHQQAPGEGGSLLVCYEATSLCMRKALCFQMTASVLGVAAAETGTACSLYD